MNTRRLFKRKKNNYKILLIILILLILIFILLYYLLFIKHSKDFVIIPENLKTFYVIPNDRGGEKVPNLDKRSLNLKNDEFQKNNLVIPEDLNYSIQFYSDTNFENVSQYLKKINNFDENIYNLAEFYILSLKTEIGIEYFLIYKNFKNKEDANNYCLKYLQRIEKCLVVDTTKF